MTRRHVRIPTAKWSTPARSKSGKASRRRPRHNGRAGFQAMPRGRLSLRPDTRGRPIFGEKGLVVPRLPQGRHKGRSAARLTCAGGRRIALASCAGLQSLKPKSYCSRRGHGSSTPCRHLTVFGGSAAHDAPQRPKRHVLVRVVRRRRRARNLPIPRGTGRMRQPFVRKVAKTAPARQEART